MRSPVIAFSIFAAAAVSPAIVTAAPTSPNIPGTGLAHSVPVEAPVHPPAGAHVRREFTDNRKSHGRHEKHQNERRVDDSRTAGGNAFSGTSGTVSGGNTINDSESDEDAITNTDSNTGGIGGETASGDAFGGDSDGRGSGGNAYSGGSRDTNGGTVANEGTNDITNLAVSNVGGDAGTTTSGDAVGGDARRFSRRQIDNAGGNIAGTGGDSTSGDAEGGHGGPTGMGGNAYTGSVGNGNGGDVLNGDGRFIPGEDDDNGGGDDGGDGGDNGGGAPGPSGPPPPPPPMRNGGGNAYSGSAGNDRGGDVVNVSDEDEDITNMAGANAPGAGGDSTTGTAFGGDA